jgi:hypothetical protein
MTVLKTMKAGCLALAITALLAAPAAAQMTWTDKGFANVNLGVQAGSHDLATSSSFELFGEQGSLATTQEVGGGLLIDFSAGYKVWRNLAVGLGYSRTSSDNDVAIAASVPDPDFFDRPRPISATETGADHVEQAIHFTGTWMMPVTDKVDVGFSFGPSIFMVKQDVPTGITVNEPGPTLETVTFTSVDDTTAGVHFGVDVTYLVTRRIGAGFLARYTWGSAEIEGADDKLSVGGFQIGAGVRARF